MRFVPDPAGASLCPKTRVSIFDFTFPSENGVHGTAIDHGVATFPWPRSLIRVYRFEISKPVLTPRSPAIRHEPIYFLFFSVPQVAPWCKGFVFWLRLRRAVFLPPRSLVRFGQTPSCGACDSGDA